ncbi:beta-lactoglobulin-1-like [Orycteropus afer afer]|uniref:Beta-lactoglobulin-1-like n=1 Tax=Orycteropus afer afer TaxID=1230840 RepID=A0A8B7B1X5_ORYAF|nr:beta-lactoglobulin-1-like [Orycteropus afer afer]
MKCLLLALGLTLICGVHTISVSQTMKDLEVQKLAGPWHSMVMAASDPTLLETENAPMRIHIKEIQPTPKDNLEMVLLKMENDRCVKRKILAQKTENPAEFKISYLSENKVFMMDTDYKTYLFICMENTTTSQQNVVCQYLARTMKADTEVMEKFKELLKTLPQHIQVFLDLTQREERCRV